MSKKTTRFRTDTTKKKHSLNGITEAINRDKRRHIKKEAIKRSKRRPIYKVSESHLDKLMHEHGLSEDKIMKADLSSADSGEINIILKRSDIPSTGIVIPYGDSDYKRVRLDKPIVINGNEAKYLSPLGSKNKLYIPEPVHEILDDTSKTLFITEGEFKALKATQEGFSCIGLSGIWGFKSNKNLLPEFKNIKLKQRIIIIVLDNDGSFNFSVLQGGTWLAIELAKLGAIPKVLTLPEIKGGIS